MQPVPSPTEAYADDVKQWSTLWLDNNAHKLTYRQIQGRDGWPLREGLALLWIKEHTPTGSKWYLRHAATRWNTSAKRLKAKVSWTRRVLRRVGA